MFASQQRSERLKSEWRQRLGIRRRVLASYTTTPNFNP